MWLRPLYRRLVRVGLPAFLVALTVGIWLSDEHRRARLADSATSIVDKI